MHNSFKVLGAADYLSDLSSEIKNAKERVLVQTMLFEPGKFTDDITDSLEITSKKVKKTVIIDWFSLIFNRKANRSPQKQNLFERLKSSGVELRFSNKPSLLERIFPYKGRNHIKVSVVDNISYIGGVNMWDKEILAIDLMVKVRSRKLSDFLIKEARSSWKKDIRLNVTRDLKIIIDKGKPGKSLILEKTTKLVKNAKREVLFMNQFAPEGSLLKVFGEVSKKNVDIEGIIPKANDFGFPLSWHSYFNDFLLSIKRLNLNTIRSEKMVHAKLLIIDRKLAIFGSHNFTSTGVLMGTNEIAVFTTNKKLVKDLVSFYNKSRNA